MTKISYIHAIPAAENADRGAEVQRARREYIPYLSLTEGEMRLELLRQRMQMFSAFYPDVPEYRRAVSLVDDVLKAGVHGGVSFIGAIPDELQQVARVIAQAVDQTRPAAGGGLLGRESIMNGIGQTLEDSQARFFKCLALNAKTAKTKDEVEEGRKRCYGLFEIEKTYNEYIEKIGHHTVYNRISQDYGDIPSRVFTKLILHDSGIEGMANTAELSKSLVSDWVENGLLAKNSSIGVGLIGSIETSFYLSTDPSQLLAKYVNWQKGRGGSKIGVEPVSTAYAVAQIVVAIAAVVGAAFKFVESLRQYKAQAMSEVKGFGTSSFSAAQSDWPIGAGNPTTGEQSNRTFTLLAAAAGAYFLLDDD